MFASNSDSNCHDIKSVLVDEIALEGLGGITLEKLWSFSGYRMSFPLNDKVKEYFWNAIKKIENLKFYNTPEPIPQVLHYVDRFSLTNEVGNIKNPDDYLDGPYNFAPVQNEYGSCDNYNTRTEIERCVLNTMSYKDVVDKWNMCFVVVASFELRCIALAPHCSKNELLALSPVQYCMLELIGKGRKNGQVTIGKSNLKLLAPDAKLLFYIRNTLKQKGFITSDKTIVTDSNRPSLALLIKLKRFQVPEHHLHPTTGVIQNMIQHLKTKDNNCDTADNIKALMHLTHQQYRKLVKVNHLKAFFKFEKNKVSLNDNNSESSSDSEQEETEPLKCQMKLGVSLLKQSYDFILKYGEVGLSIQELIDLMGIDYYIARKISIVLKKSTLVKEILVDVGRSKMGKLVAIESMNINKSMNEYVKQKEQYMNTVSEMDTTEQPSTSAENQSEDVVEISLGTDRNKIDKAPTLKHFKVFNIILKVVKEKNVVSSIEILRTIQKEMGLLVDKKSAYNAIDYLAKNKQVKVLKMTKNNKNLVLVCKYGITSDHPSFKKASNEFAVVSLSNPLKAEVVATLPDNVKKEQSKLINIIYSIPTYTYYSKLHVCLFQLAYESDFVRSSIDANWPKGFLSLVDVIPELPVSLVLSSISRRRNVTFMQKILNDNIKQLKLKDLTQDVYLILLKSCQLLSHLKYRISVLSDFGLVQLLSGNESLASTTFYINKNVSLVNTLGPWPTKKVKETIKYHLNSNKDVTEFWDTVQNISLRTKVLTPKRDSKLTIVYRTYNEIINSNDSSAIHGDGLGPCGFHSSYHTDHKHKWANIIKIKEPVKRKLEGIDKYPIVITKRNKIKEGEAKPEKPKRISAVAINTRKSKSYNAVLPSDAKSPWKPFEDQVLILCRAIQRLFGDCSMSEKINNYTSRDILNALGEHKTYQLCKLRMKNLEKVCSHEIERLLKIIRRNPKHFDKYENCCLEGENVASDKISRQCKHNFLECLLLISRLYDTENSTNKVEKLALSLQAFKDNYNYELITPLIKNPFDEFSDTENTLKATACQLILLLLNQKHQNPNNVLKQFEERVLRQSIYILHHVLCFVTHRIKNQSLKNDLKSGKQKVSGLYKVSKTYKNKIKCEHFSKYLENIARDVECLKNEEITTVGPSQTVLFGELASSDSIDIILESNPTVNTTPVDDDDEDNVPNLIPGKMVVKLLQPLDEIQKSPCLDQLQEILQKFKRNFHVIMPKTTIKDETQCKIEIILEKSQESGVGLFDLVDELNISLEETTKALRAMKENNYIKYVGMFDGKVILTKYCKPWSFINTNTRLIPTSFISENHINMTYIAAACKKLIHTAIQIPGSTCKKLATMSEVMLPVEVKIFSELLSEFKCVKLICIKPRECNVFSGDETNETCDDVEFASPEFIHVILLNDCIKKIALLYEKFLSLGEINISV